MLAIQEQHVILVQLGTPEILVAHALMVTMLHRHLPLLARPVLLLERSAQPAPIPHLARLAHTVMEEQHVVAAQLDTQGMDVRSAMSDTF